METSNPANIPPLVNWPYTPPPSAHPTCNHGTVAVMSRCSHSGTHVSWKGRGQWYNYTCCEAWCTYTYNGIIITCILYTV